jgi:mannose-6-phosphate isomerase-like protein (cupin superfamily)
MSGQMIGSAAAPYAARGLHGGWGTVHVKRMATGNQMFSDVDSFEFVEIAPNSCGGLHVHTRTEELYFILSGRGLLTQGDEQLEVGPGDLHLLSLHDQHELETIGDEPIRMIVIEALPPEIVRQLPTHRPAVARKEA